VKKSSNAAAAEGIRRPELILAHPHDARVLLQNRNVLPDASALDALTG